MTKSDGQFGEKLRHLERKKDVEGHAVGDRLIKEGQNYSIQRLKTLLGRGDGATWYAVISCPVVKRKRQYY